jgi:hypothetical protein
VNPSPEQPSTDLPPVKKVIWVKVALILVFLLPFISTLFYFVYFWLHGVTLAR